MTLDYFPELEADLRRFYSIDLASALWGPEPIGARTYASYVNALPSDSALIRSLVPGRREGWGNVEELLATLAEICFETMRITLAAWSKEGTTIPERLHIPRPGEPVAPRRRMATPEEMRQFFGGAGAVQYVGGDR